MRDAGKFFSLAWMPSWHGDSVCLSGLAHLLEVDLEVILERNQLCRARTWGEFRGGKLRGRMRRKDGVTSSVLRRQ